MAQSGCTQQRYPKRRPWSQTVDTLIMLCSRKIWAGFVADPVRLYAERHALRTTFSTRYPASTPAGNQSTKFMSVQTDRYSPVTRLGRIFLHIPDTPSRCNSTIAEEYFFLTFQAHQPRRACLHLTRSWESWMKHNVTKHQLHLRGSSGVTHAQCPDNYHYS